MRHLQKIKEDLKRSREITLPSPLQVKYNTFLMAGSLCLPAGILLFFFKGISVSSLPALLFPVLIGIFLLAAGVLYRIGIGKNGWIEITGVCMDHYNPAAFLPGRKKGADAFLLDAPGAMVFVPAVKRSSVPPVGSRIRLYVSKAASSYIGQNGVLHYDSIYGYEILPAAERE